MLFVSAEPPAAAQVELTARPDATMTTAQVILGSEGDASPQSLEIDSELESTDYRPQSVDVPEEYDWNDQGTQGRFGRLEAKVMAQQGAAEEIQAYQKMRRSRNAFIFARTYILDYAEEQRLRLLTEKLAEIERYLKPIGTR